MCVCVHYYMVILTAEVWLSPLMHWSSGTETGISISLELVTQCLQQSIIAAHIKHTALEEWQGVHHLYTIPMVVIGINRIREQK